MSSLPEPQLPQQARAKATRDAILVAAAEEFDRAGYQATPLSAILRRSRVTKGAFYFHFRSKESLAVALIQAQNQRWPRLGQQWLRRGLDPLTTAIGMIDESARLIHEDVVLRAGVRLACRPAEPEMAVWLPYPAWEQMLSELLRRSAEQGLLRDGVDPEAAARVLHAVVVGAREIGAEVPSRVDLPSRVAEMWRVLLPGIASSEWWRNSQLARKFTEGVAPSAAGNNPESQG